MTIIVNTASPSTPRALMAAEIWTPLTNAPFDHIEPRPTQLARKSAGDLDGTTERVPGDYGLLRSDRGRDPLEHAAAIDGETWAQSITVWYERARGLRLKHQQADDFTFYASRTISVPVEVLFDGVREHALAAEVAHRRNDVAADVASGPPGSLRLGGRLDAGERLVPREGPGESIGRCGA